MKILILGPGYLGLSAGRYLQKKGHIITGTTRSKEKLPLLKELDASILISHENLLQAFENQEIILFSTGADHAASYQETYLENAKMIVKAFETYPSLKQVIYTGSTSVYGEHGGHRVTEETLPVPLSVQTKILLESEKTLQQLPQSCIFRLGELIGQGRTIEDRLVQANGVPFSGTGESITNFSPLSDVIRAIDFAIEHNLTGIYNVCSNLHAPRKELYDQITTAKGLKKIKWEPKSASLHGGNKTIVSDKIQKAGFSFESLPWEGILTTA